MAAEASRSGASADSYIGSLISLTSKFEIRYEGILYNINTDESSIGLRNVRSFGTEGRKKDGPQVPASDKIYEYILFRGSDIKDLQVKSSPPVQALFMHNDPAIIQSHYSNPTSAPTSSPFADTVPDPSSHTAQSGLPRSPFQGSLPLPQAGGSLGSWGSSPTPPTQNGSGLAMPLYWQGYYPSSGGLPHLQQPPLFRPPLGVPLPHSMQPLQYPGMSASLPSGLPNLPEFPPPPASLSQPANSSHNLTYTTMPSLYTPSQASSAAPDTPPNLSYKPLGANLSTMPPLTSSFESMPPFVTSKPSTVPGPAMVPQATSQSMPLVAGSSGPSQVESSVPFIAPGQLMQHSLSSLPSSQPLQTSLKAVEIKPPEALIKSSVPEPLLPAPSGAKQRILPLPTPADQKPNVAALHAHYGSRGHGRGSGNGYRHSVTKFTEEFDFTAMNEKFNKDEVWGHLGKSKAQLRDREEEIEADEALEDYDDDAAQSSKLETNPVYVKDDFFDSLSSNALDRGTRNGRTRFSEQLKIDTETFGDFQSHRMGRGGGGRGFRGGRMRGGGYNGRGGYGYVGGRGRGRNFGNHAGLDFGY